MHPDLMEAVLAQMAMCPNQLKEAFHEGIASLKFSVDDADYADEIHNYMSLVFDIGVPILGLSIPRPPAPQGAFPRYYPTTSRPTAPSTTPSSSSTSTSQPQAKPAPRKARMILDELD